MRKLIASRSVWLGSALFGAFLVERHFAPDHENLIGLRVLQIASAIGVLVVYWPDVIEALCARRPDRVQCLILGIGLSFAGIVGQALWGLLWRLGGEPAWFANTDWQGLWIWCSILAAILHTTAPGAIGGTVPKRNRIALGAVIAGAVLVILFLLTTQPNIGGVLERLRPYVGDELLSLPTRHS